MNQDILRKYAELIIRVGVNLQDGQNLVIRGEPIHWPFISLLQEAAYIAGARFIKSDIQDPASKINKIKYSKDEYLESLPSYLEKEVETMVEEKWAMIHLDGQNDPDCYELLDQVKNARIEKVVREKSKNLTLAAMNGSCHWCIAPMPTAGWASKIFNIEATEEAKLRLWDCLSTILRLDHDDPILAWQNHDRELKRRIERLAKENISYLHFEAPNTNLKIFLNKKSLWTGGSFDSLSNIPFIPNLPTEEIFTTPDFSKTEGTVQVTRPVSVMGKSIKNAWFEFKEGKVINYKAETNQEVLDEYFKLDESARYLGEVALVDETSPIAKTKTLFHSILLDENASCHIALGRGISVAIDGGRNMNEQELKDAGCNMSLLHTDFMIGSDELDITAHTNDGNTVTILKDGYFKI